MKTYTGRDVGKIIEPALKKAKKRIVVIAPWVSKKYLSILVDKAKKGAHVIVVTTTKNKAVGAFKPCGRPSWKKVLISIIIPPLFFYYLWKRLRSEKFPFEMYVVDESNFIHSKIYVFDDVVITGSANLTHSGLWKNEETVIVIPKGSQKDVLRDVKKVVERARKNAVIKISCRG
ncbi:MAG: phosphatidylserine/phosphatidylglycerophosphate/cardiolipin synthase family protein [Crenarchaeota archaeon]|nr:phosphatidylserine/phosphatidylglycerophosphate/cardiolipin synthase family protein [Thermoproteota archaeon]